MNRVVSPIVWHPGRLIDAAEVMDRQQLQMGDPEFFQIIEAGTVLASRSHSGLDDAAIQTLHLTHRGRMAREVPDVQFIDDRIGRFPKRRPFRRRDMGGDMRLDIDQYAKFAIQADGFRVRIDDLVRFDWRLDVQSIIVTFIKPRHVGMPDTTALFRHTKPLDFTMCRRVVDDEPNRERDGRPNVCLDRVFGKSEAERSVIGITAFELVRMHDFTWHDDNRFMSGVKYSIDRFKRDRSRQSDISLNRTGLCRPFIEHHIVDRSTVLFNLYWNGFIFGDDFQSNRLEREQRCPFNRHM